MGRDLSKLLCPSSVAIIGASRSEDKVGGILIKNVINSPFSGDIFPVNPNASEIQGLKCYPDYNSLPKVPDLALVAVPADKVNAALTAIGEKGTKNAIVLTAGFKEIGEDGARLEKELIAIASTFDINLVGPNCLGLVNNLCPLNASFGKAATLPGNLRFLSQSGAIATAVFDWCSQTKLWFASFVTLGNKAVLSENDFLAYFLDHPTRGEPIGMYLESITHGQEFIKLAKKMGLTNPVFVLKPGRSAGAAKAMQSHTGAIAGEDRVFNQAVLEAGITRCDEIEDFFDLARAFSWEKTPIGPKIAVISNAGGPAVVSADAAAKEGLTLVELNLDTQQKLEQILPREASVHNPVDVLGDALPDRFFKSAEIVLSESDVNGLIIILTPQMMTQIENTANLIGQLSQKYPQPIFCSFIGGSLVASGEAILNDLKIPSFRFPERAIKAMGAMWRWENWRKSAVQTQISADHVPVPNLTASLDSIAINTILSQAGISVPPSCEVQDLAQATDFSTKVGYPVVLKLSVPGLLHKTEIGGVITNIKNDQDLMIAFATLEPKLPDQGRIQIQKQIVGGTELIVGVKRDPNFGPVLLFGAGGTYAEILGDVNLHLLPISPSEIENLIHHSKIFPLLSGYRGKPLLPISKLVHLIKTLADLACSSPQISEIEINPVILTPTEAYAVDGKIVLAD